MKIKGSSKLGAKNGASHFGHVLGWAVQGRFLRAHLAGFMVDVEGGDDALGQLPALSEDHVLGQAVGQVGLARAAGAGQDDAPVLHQQGHVALQDGLRDQRLEHQPVQTALAQTCSGETALAHREAQPVSKLTRPSCSSLQSPTPSPPWYPSRLREARVKLEKQVQG